MKRLATLIVLPLLATGVLAAEPVTIGWVDMQAVIEQSKMGKDARSRLEKKYEAPQQELNKEEQAIRQLQQTTSRDAALMSQSELDKRKADLQERVEQFQRQAMAAQQELGRDQTKLGNEIVSAAKEIIAELAKERKLTAVFERNSSGLLYVENGLSLTDKVIERMDTRSAK